MTQQTMPNSAEPSGTSRISGAMSADDFRDYMLSFLFLRYLSDNYVEAARKELGSDYPESSGSFQLPGSGKESRMLSPLSKWYA